MKLYAVAYGAFRQLSSSSQSGIGSVVVVRRNIYEAREDAKIACLSAFPPSDGWTSHNVADGVEVDKSVIDQVS